MYKQGRRAGALKPISEFLEPVTAPLGLKERLLEERVRQAWESGLPEVWKANVHFQNFKKGTLQVSCSSSSWAQEVRLLRGELINRLNSCLKEELVVEIKATGLTKKG